MIDYFNIKDKKVISDLKMIIYIKKYEMIVKSIKYFFDINISEMNMNNLKKTLSELEKIYEHKQNNSY